MKVLVFDDTQAHRTSAEVLLKSHELTVVGTYDEAQDALKVNVDFVEIEKKMDQIMESNYPDYDYKTASDELKEAIHKERINVLKECTTYPKFDAVLTDLMVPASDQNLGRGMHLAGEEMPLGSVIALLALSNGVKKVAVATDMDHHSHPASAALDCFGFTKSNPSFQLICTNRINFVWINEETKEVVSDEFVNSPEGSAKYPGDWKSRQGLIQGKDWAEIITRFDK